MSIKEKELPDWAKIPQPLQDKFFEYAAKEASLTKDRLKEKQRRLEELAKRLSFKPLPRYDEWERLRVAVVDGSNSPSTSERLGVRFGTYSAGYLLFEGSKAIDEGYQSGWFTQAQIGSQEVAQKVLTMLRFRLEREVALRCLEELDADYVVLDGSFFGFRADASYINDEIIDIEGYERGIDLTKEVRDKTSKLLKSRKVVGIIKRTRTNALDGWLAYEKGDEASCIESNDKHILARLMKPGTWFAYEWVLKPPDKTDPRIAHHYFNAYRKTYRFWTHVKRMPRDRVAIFESAKNTAEKTIWKALRMSSSWILRTARYYVRCCGAPPFELEAPLDMELEPLLGYFSSFYNPATGLPWPLDLVDENVSLPRGFTREFVEEVEAQLMRDPEVRDKLGIADYFSPLNPQKDEG